MMPIDEAAEHLARSLGAAVESGQPIPHQLLMLMFHDSTTLSFTNSSDAPWPDPAGHLADMIAASQATQALLASTAQFAHTDGAAMVIAVHAVDRSGTSLQIIPINKDPDGRLVVSGELTDVVDADPPTWLSTAIADGQ